MNIKETPVKFYLIKPVFEHFKGQRIFICPSFPILKEGNILMKYLRVCERIDLEKNLTEIHSIISSLPKNEDTEDNFYLNYMDNKEKLENEETLISIFPFKPDMLLESTNLLFDSTGFQFKWFNGIRTTIITDSKKKLDHLK